jgi:hypothetical protein
MIKFVLAYRHAIPGTRLHDPRFVPLWRIQQSGAVCPAKPSADVDT